MWLSFCLTMSDDENPLTTLGQSLTAKPLGTVKELAKALGDVTLKLEQITSTIRDDIKAVASNGTASLSEVQELKKCMSGMDAKLEQFRAEIQNAVRDVAEVKQHQVETNDEVRELRQEVFEMQQEIIDLKQYSRRSNLEIKGVPPTAEESLPDIMLTIASCLKSNLRVEDIDVIHRVPTKDKNRPNIIVKFLSKRTRDELLVKAKKQRLTGSVLGFEANEPIYINEHLCPEYKVLLAKAIQMKRDKNWKFAWVSQGKILMRKAENTRVVHITCEADLGKII